MSKLDDAAKEIVRALTESTARKTSGYDTLAEVKRVDGNIAWVHIDGGVDETPVSVSIDCKKGDMVRVRVSNGTAFIIGNETKPPTDDTTAISAHTVATTANTKAVIAEETAEVADQNAGVAKKTAEAILVYDHDYTLMADQNNRMYAHFTAFLYRGGVDIKNYFDAQQFTWYLKNEDTAEMQFLGYGYNIDVYLSDAGYGSEVVGHFTTTEDAEALTSNNENLTDNTDTNYTVRANGDSVRVSDLSVSTLLYDVDKLMVVGTENEHLITMDTLYSYMLNRISDDAGVIYCGSATEVI